MSRSYEIQLYFDTGLENQVLKAWNILSLRQITTQLIKIESRPHITLLSTPFVDPLKLSIPFKTFVSNQIQPLDVTFSTIGSFPNDPTTVFLGPTPTLSLLNLQTQLSELVRREGNVEVMREFCSDSWIPHCIVAQDIPRVRMAEAFCVLRDLNLPISGCAVEIGLVEFLPDTGCAMGIFSYSLGNSSEY
ncbi:hypothetical protein GIB67_003407 [Kingdonia uniflora]|uniref:RNA ligase/cyclic nucleotide phosphodiesterase family protein n=1 Tax=Kingdonia uniflora TaxID=39325 RepID=A0A7J7P932_9MAGN|nr:hypothetical protein GIB67_003407 [Kingdonia uniflora]